MRRKDPTSITQFMIPNDQNLTLRINREEDRLIKMEAQRTGLPENFIKFMRELGPLEQAENPNPPPTQAERFAAADPFTIVAKPRLAGPHGTFRRNMPRENPPPPPPQRNVQPEIKGGFVPPQAQSIQKNTPLMRELQSTLPALKQTTQGASGAMNFMGLNQPIGGEALHTARMAPQTDILKFLESYSEPKSWTNIGKITANNLVSNRW